MNRDQLNAAIREEFPDYDTVIEPVKGFANTSWHNDSSPSLSITIGDYEARIWLGYKNPELRMHHADNDPQFAYTVDHRESGDIHAEYVDFVRADAAEYLLSKIYVHWCDAQKLPAMSADELLYENVTDDQAAWLERFMEIWATAV